MGTAMATATRYRGEMGGISSLDDLDTAIRAVGVCELTIQQIEKELSLALEREKAAAADRSAEAMSERKTLLALIQTYVEANREKVLMGKKTAKLNHGKVGYRAVTRLHDLPNKNTPEMSALVEKLEALKNADWKRFHAASVITDRYIKKTTVDGLADDALVELGLERIRDDVFFVEPAKQKIVDTEAKP